MQPNDAKRATPASTRQRPGDRHPLRALLVAALPLTALLATPPAASASSASSAAGVNPLPAVAAALSGVTRYQVVVTITTTGRRPTGLPRPARTPTPGGTPRRGTGFRFGVGPQTRTIVAVRKGNIYEDDIVITGHDTAGKAVTMEVVDYGATRCTRANGARSYTCSPLQGSFALDPTSEFAAGGGGATFTPAGAKTIGGQACDGYSYQNVSQGTTTRGVVYIARATHLPCAQNATVTRQFQGGSFTQTSAIVWSRFNDARLTVPSFPPK